MKKVNFSKTAEILLKIAGFVAWIPFAYFTNWQAAVSLFIILWANNQMMSRW